MATQVAAEQQDQITINLQQSIGMNETASTATLYLKKIIEQRTDQRIKLLLHYELPGSRSKKNVPAASMQMAVISKNKQTGEPNHPTPSKHSLGSTRDKSYQLMIDDNFWEQLNADLKIILRGAAEDTIEYVSELNEKN